MLQLLILWEKFFLEHSPSLIRHPKNRGQKSNCLRHSRLLWARPSWYHQYQQTQAMWILSIISLVHLSMVVVLFNSIISSVLLISSSVIVHCLITQCSVSMRLTIQYHCFTCNRTSFVVFSSRSISSIVVVHCRISCRITQCSVIWG